MAKDKAALKKRREYIKGQLKLHPPVGSELVLYGSVIILLWALGELNASYTFILAWFKTDSRIIELGYISAKDYFFEIILKTPEALDALKQLAVLALGVIMGILGIVLRKRKISVPLIITSIIIAFYEVADPFWMRVTDYTRYIKLTGCALTLAGSLSKTATWVVRRKIAADEYDKAIREKRRTKEALRRDKTLIPERTETKRK